MKAKYVDDYVDTYCLTHDCTHPAIVAQRKRLRNTPMEQIARENAKKRKLDEHVRANLTGDDVFLTFTSVEPFRSDKKLFLKHLNDFIREDVELAGKRYVYVLETFKNGGFHAHGIFFDTTIADNDKLGLRYGAFTKTVKIYSPGVAGYLTKYMSKAPAGERSFYRSKTLYKQASTTFAVKYFGNIVKIVNTPL